jgi:hypothetical protein
MGRKSSIRQLPSDILRQLEQLLLDPRCTQLDVTWKINALLEEAGQPKITKSSVGRYAQSFEEMTKDVAEADRLSALLLKELNITNQSNVSQATAELLKVSLMKAIPLLRTVMEKEDMTPKELKEVTATLKDLSSSHERLENSATINEKRRLEIEKAASQKAKEQAANTAEETAKAHGLDADFAKFLREKVLQGGV